MKKILFGAGLLVLSILIPFAALIPLFFMKDNSVTFPGPGSKTLTVTEAKKYYIWNQYEGSNDGKVYSSSEEFPSGVSFELVPKDSEEDIPFETDASITTSFGGSKRKSIGYFEIAKPGEYTLTIADLPEERLFSWGPSPFEKLSGWIVGIIALGFLIFASVIGSLVLIVFGIIELSKKSNPPVPAP